MSLTSNAKSSTHVSKRQLQDQISALQSEVDELHSKFNQPSWIGARPGTVADNIIEKQVESRVKDAIEGGITPPTFTSASIDGIVSSDYPPPPPGSDQGVSTSAPTQTRGFNGLLLDPSPNNEHHTEMPISGSQSLLDIPAGASTLLSQLARAQRALQDMTLERNELSRSLREEKEANRERSHSPHSTEALAMMRELYGSLEKDHELLRLTLENSEKIRRQQKELILLMQSSARGTRSNSPAPRTNRRRVGRSPSRGNGKDSPERRPSLGLSSDILIGDYKNPASASGSSMAGSSRSTTPEENNQNKINKEKRRSTVGSGSTVRRSSTTKNLKPSSRTGSKANKSVNPTATTGATGLRRGRGFR